MADLSVVMKISRLCNLRCTYCTDWRTGPGQSMSFEVMAHAIAACLRDPAYERVSFNWHGGEPTLVPIERYEKALELQARLRHPHQFVRNTMQSNGTRVTPELIDFLQRNAFDLGISLDGPPEIHDRYRVAADGSPTYDEVMAGISQLADAGIPVSALMVVSDDVLAAGADRVFDTFRSLGISHFGLNQVRPVNQPHVPANTPTVNYADPPRYTAFLARLFDRWVEHGDPTIRIREIDSLLRRLGGATPPLCSFAGGCFGLIYQIEPGGDIVHCGHFDGDDRYTLGNAVTDDFADILDSATFRARVAENEAELDALRACPEFDVCNGWCPHDRYLSVRHNPAHRPDCCGLAGLIGHIRSRLDDVAAMGGLPAAATTVASASL